MKKNEEATRQMEQIWREHHSPDAQERKRQKLKREANKKSRAEDLGL